MRIPKPSHFGSISSDFSNGSQRLSLPRDINPRRYLSFAIEDLASGKNARCTVNALSNAKRALHFQVEVIASAFGLDCKSQRSFPSKLQFCQDCGVVGPRVLSKLNQVRNAVEHDYVIPTRDEIEDYVDVVELFLAATDRFIFQFPCDLEFLAEPINKGDVDISYVELEPSSGEITLKGRSIHRACKKYEGWIDEDGWKVLKIPSSSKEYFDWVRVLVNASMYF